MVFACMVIFWLMTSGEQIKMFDRTISYETFIALLRNALSPALLSSNDPLVIVVEDSASQGEDSASHEEASENKQEAEDLQIEA